MKQLSKEVKKILQSKWKERLKLYAEADPLHAEADLLYAKANQLWAEADLLWDETVLKFCGDIKLEWEQRENKVSNACILESGDIFEP